MTSDADRLPRDNPFVAMQCCQLDQSGNRCQNRAKHEYRCFADKKLYDTKWFVTYVCNAHLAELLQVSAITNAGEDEYWMTPRKDTPRTYT